MAHSPSTNVARPPIPVYPTQITAETGNTISGRTCLVPWHPSLPNIDFPFCSDCEGSIQPHKGTTFSDDPGLFFTKKNCMFEHRLASRHPRVSTIGVEPRHSSKSDSSSFESDHNWNPAVCLSLLDSKALAQRDQTTSAVVCDDYSVPLLYLQKCQLRLHKKLPSRKLSMFSWPQPRRVVNVNSPPCSWTWSIGQAGPSITRYFIRSTSLPP